MDLINSKISPNTLYIFLLVDCKSLLSRISLVRVKYVYRETNRCANALARNGCKMQEDFVVFDVSPLLLFHPWCAWMSMGLIIVGFRPPT